jgi:hypothetical protein
MRIDAERGPLTIYPQNRPGKRKSPVSGAFS